MESSHQIIILPSQRHGPNPSIPDPHYGCLSNTVSLCCMILARGFAKIATKPNNTINYKIGVQEYVSACLRTSEGVLTDDDRWQEASHGNSSDRSTHPNINDLGLLIRA